MLGGDFNATLNADESNRPGGGLANRKDFKIFSLMDLPLSGGRFTWTNSQQPPLLIRLDKFLISTDFYAHCPAPIQMRLHMQYLIIRKSCFVVTQGIRLNHHSG